MIMIAAALIIFFFTFRVYSTDRKIEQYYPTFFIFSSTGVLYFLGVPIEHIIRGNNYYSSPMGLVPLDYTFQLKLSANALVAIFLFYVGYKKSQIKLFAPLPRSRVFPGNILSIYVVPIILLSVGLIFFFEQIEKASGYVGAYETMSSDSTYAFIISTFISSCAIAAFHSFNNLSFFRLLLGLLFLSLNIVWVFYTYDRDSALVALLALGAITSKKKLSPRKEIASILIVFFLVLSLFQFISFFRAEAKNISFNMRDVSLERSDTYGVFFSIAESLEKDTDFGINKYEVAFLLIPKFVWPQRPNGLAEVFARKYMKSWRPGQGYAYSMLAESYLTLGIVGVALHYLIFGYLWGVIWNKIRSLLKNERYFNSLYFVLGYNLLILCHRYTIGGVLKKFVHVMLLYFIAVLLFDFVLASAFKKRD